VRRRTLKELAKALDISVATASRALGGYPDIAVKTRERVAQKAREIGYVPNSAGRMLVSGRTGFVGLVVPARGPQFVDAFIGQFVTGLGEGLVARGCDLFLAIATHGQSEVEVIRHLVDSGRADGLVLTRIAENDPRVNFLIERQFPFVAHGQLLGDARPYHWMDTDGTAAFAKAFDILYDLGHRRFGLVTISEPMTFRHHRELGLRHAIAARGDPAVTLAVAQSPRGDAAARSEAVHHMLTRPDRPTAVVGLFDELALTAMQEAARMGLSVPGDLSVIGFDNITASAFSTPGLSTFDQDTHASALSIAHMICDVIETNPQTPMTVLKTAGFVCRGSQGPAPPLS
jgi:LacI family transcriptional regulator